MLLKRDAREPSIYALECKRGFPTHLYARPGRTFDWLFTDWFRVWPAGHYRDWFVVEAANAEQARELAADALDLEPHQVKAQMMPAAAGLGGKGLC